MKYLHPLSTPRVRPDRGLVATLSVLCASQSVVMERLAPVGKKDMDHPLLRRMDHTQRGADRVEFQDYRATNDSSWARLSRNASPRCLVTEAGYRTSLVFRRSSRDVDALLKIPTRLGADEHCQQLTDRRVSIRVFSQGHVDLNPVAIAAAVLVL